jgi:hypothetical protein
VSYGAGKRQWPARTPHTNQAPRLLRVALKNAGLRDSGGDWHRKPPARKEFTSRFFRGALQETEGGKSDADPAGEFLPGSPFRPNKPIVE